jgi:hypothetical protein
MASSSPPIVLLFASSLRTGADYEPALRERGYEVVRAASTRSVERIVRDARIELVVLDCGTSEAERAIRVLNSLGRSVPRVWVSSSPDAPRQSGHFGVDVLLIDPDDVVAVITSVERILAPRGRVERPHPFMADGTNPAGARVRPRGTGPVTPERVAVKERDPSTSWDDPTSDWKLRGKSGAD